MTSHRLSEPEIWAFIGSEPPHTGKLATVRADGAPHVAPVWFALDDETLVFTTGADTVKGRTLRRQGRAALCVDDERPPFTFALVCGPVEITEDPTSLRRWAGVIGGRYLGPERASEMAARNGGPGELLVRLLPQKMTSMADLSD